MEGVSDAVFSAYFAAFAVGLGTFERRDGMVVIARDGAVVAEIIVHGFG